MGGGPNLRRRVRHGTQDRAWHGLRAGRPHAGTEPDGARADRHRWLLCLRRLHILERGREPIEDCVVELDADRATEDPKVFTRIHMRFVVRGRALARSKVERAVDLSVEKYCSASAMLAKTATITHEVEVIDTSPTA